MQKIIVIGCPGSGKSTFSKSLHKITGIPLFHLDMMFWNADKTAVEQSVFHERLSKTIQNDEWIIDAHSSRTKYDTLPLIFKLKNGEVIDILGYNHQFRKLLTADNRSVFNLTHETSALLAELFEIK